jgi:outer membrane protein assembly factor BamB
MSWKEKLSGLLGIVLLCFICERLGHASMHGMVWLIMVVPAVLTVWAGWWLITRKQPPRIRTGGLVLISFFLPTPPAPSSAWTASAANKAPICTWRWSPTKEQLYLAQLTPTRPPTTSGAAEGTLTSTATDWPGLRGLGRDGIVSGLTISTNWSAHPPRQLWRVRVGPGWSSPVAIGGRVFTQEQRGPNEVVACRNLIDGKECWTHEDSVRFEEGMSGPGPRATPLFVDGKLFTLGATGVLNCLDAATGNLKWSADLAKEGVKPPIWGFSSSPVVTQGMVIVYAGGAKGLIAYRADSGKLAWYVPSGEQSYWPPQLMKIAGVEQVVFLRDHSAIAVDPLTGKQLWEEVISAPGAPRAIQPHAISDSQLLVSSETDLGTAVLEITNTSGTWAAKRKWVTRSLKPSFDDFVVLDGFDGAVFCCTNLSDGKRKWREGRYGHGQVLLLQDQKLLLVLGEEGEVMLLRATPDKNDELARFTAITGKTWNHPAIARGKLIVRNGEEMACFDLDLLTTK